MQFGRLVLGVMLVGAVAGGWSAMGMSGVKDSHKNTEASDPWLWLEDIHGARPMDWVKAQNAKSTAILQADPDYQKDYDAVLAVMDATDRIPYGNIDHNNVFNFWQDAAHPKGIWRRTTIADYAKPAPDWETLIDLDKLAADEHENWVWKGADCAPSLAHCLVNLSRGGGDAVVVREFDLGSKSFLKDGFTLAEAKSSITYLDEDSVLFGTDFGAGSLTTSGYPNVVKLWKRGTKMADAKTVYTGKLSDVASAGAVFLDGQDFAGKQKSIALINRAPSFFESEYFYLHPDGTTTKLPLPLSADVKGVAAHNLILTLRDAWTYGKETYAKGSLLAIPLYSFEQSGNFDTIRILYTPGPQSSIEQVATGPTTVYASIFDNVVGHIAIFRRGFDDNWSSENLELPPGGSTHIISTNDFGGEAYFSYEGFLTPATLYAYDSNRLDQPVAIKSLPARFDASNLMTEQFFATSKDGTQIPYFVTRPKTLNGPTPTVLYGYGGFEISETPVYSTNFGMLWLAKGGVYVLANIRGGGEFGPAWHQAALLANRQKAYDDFQAVAEDLVKRGITTPKQLGIMGGSNGGLLVSANMVERPDLFGAVVCQVPLIDMIRYTQIGAGASWIAEYGDPADAKAREWIMKYSPYQNVKPGVKMPPVLFVTATSDDRVTPVHARKMAAKMEAQGHDVLFYENTDGGHAAAANHKQGAEMWALSFVYLKQELGLH